MPNGHFSSHILQSGWHRSSSIFMSLNNKGYASFSTAGDLSSPLMDNLIAPNGQVTAQIAWKSHLDSSTSTSGGWAFPSGLLGIGLSLIASLGHASLQIIQPLQI